MFVPMRHSNPHGCVHDHVLKRRITALSQRYDIAVHAPSPCFLMKNKTINLPNGKKKFGLWLNFRRPLECIDGWKNLLGVNGAMITTIEKFPKRCCHRFRQPFEPMHWMCQQDVCPEPLWHFGSLEALYFRHLRRCQAWLEQFLTVRFTHFGDYEDAR